MLRRCAVLIVLASGVLLTPSLARAQQGPAYTLNQVERLLQARVPGILDDLRRDCIAFEITDEAVTRLRAAGADDAFIAGIREVCKRLPAEPPQGAQPPARREPTPAREEVPQTVRAPVSPGSAAVRSLVVPGLGQFATGKPALGVVFLAAWGGALGFGLMSQETTIECLAAGADPCPANQVRDEVVKRPMLAVGVGGALAVAVVSALHARSAAASGLAAGGAPAGPAPRFAIEPVLPGPRGHGTGLQLRVRF
jgi:hypothetical protein